MDTDHKLILGQEVFVLSKEGQVARTMVAKIYSCDSYLFLDGTCSKYWLSYDEAVSAAVGLVTEKEQQLRQQLTALRRRRRDLLTTEAYTPVMEKPFKVVDLSDAEHRLRTRKLKKVTVPVEYPQPGAMVYIAVTENLRTGKYEYRPHKSFILEDLISSVWFTPDGAYHVSLSNPYRINEYFPTHEAALAAHPTISAVVPYEEFKEGQVDFDWKNPVF